MANIKNNAAAQETRRKLIEAAGEIFAEKGLHATLIRDITARAGVNVAAVNYHFKDKYELYLTVVRQIHDEAIQATTPPDLHAPPEARLRAFVEALMRYMLDPHRPAWHAALFAREISYPTAALDEAIQRGARGHVEKMGAVIGELLGGKADRRTVTMAAFSILGQCLFYLRDKPLVDRLSPPLAQVDAIGPLVDHITRFSLAGIMALTSAGAGGPARTGRRRARPDDQHHPKPRRRRI